MGRRHAEARWSPWDLLRAAMGETNQAIPSLHGSPTTRRNDKGHRGTPKETSSALQLYYPHVKCQPGTTPVMHLGATSRRGARGVGTLGLVISMPTCGLAQEGFPLCIAKYLFPPKEPLGKNQLWHEETLIC